MDLTALSGATTIALACTIIFLLVVKSWHAFTISTSSTRFPNAIMFEAAQRFRDELERLGREQSVYLISALVFAVIFCVFYLLPPIGLFDNLPMWQLYLLVGIFIVAAGYSFYRLFRIAVARRRLAFVRDANMATGHALQKLTTNQNRAFHDVRCQAGIIDNVIVGLHGVYAISVISRKPGKNNLVRLNGDMLSFAPGKESVSVSRSGKKSEQLAREFRKVVNHEVRVRSVIAVPGWEVESQVSDKYLVVNERNLAMLSGWKDQEDYLMDEDVEAIQKLLTRRCTRFAK
jgi:hypothetical protein